MLSAANVGSRFSLKSLIRIAFKPPLQISFIHAPRFLTSLLLAMLLPAILLASCSAPRQGTGTADNPQTVIPTNRPIEITAADLVKAYEENIVSADYRYTDKLLSVSSEVIRIQRYPEFIQVHLRAGSSGEYLNCVFTNQRFEDVLPLKVGERATIKGACRGKKTDSGSAIVIDECFISLTETPQPTKGSILPPISSKPTVQPSTSSGATARCRDGTLSYSQHRQGTCSHHGGVAEWY